MGLISLRSVTAGYAKKSVLRDVSLDINRGDFLGIIGPNGAGKSTLLRVLSGYLRPFSGKVLFRDAERSAAGKKCLAREISVVSQSMEGVPPFPVRDYVALGRFPHQRALSLPSGEDVRIVSAAIEAVGITHLASRPLGALSGGERQLAHIARALAQSGSVMLLDEPISHLDISHAIRVMDTLHSMRQRGITVVAVLHDINMASEYCSRLVAVREGSVFFDGAPEEVMTYTNVESLFGTVCVVTQNPSSRKPLTYPVPGYVRNQER